MTLQPMPQLDAPGAGLPIIETFLLRYWVFPKACRKLNWESAHEFHQSEGKKIIALAEPLSQQELNTRVLVKRIRGIEDSSRNWSVAMTMEHLVVVGDLTRQAIQSLSRHEMPNGKADVAQVKPHGIYQERAAIPTYQAFLMRYRTLIERELKDRDSPLRFKHPWLGMLTAFQWHCLAAAHTHLHRKQIISIISGLKKP